jgi:ketol-acid reductoisomerase
VFEVQNLVLATGATPRTLDLPTPAIPLSVALNPTARANIVSSEDKVVVFGTAHSGTLVLKNLRDCGVRTLTGLYRGAQPYQYARDGYSEGIKQESATIADSITTEGWATLVPLDDFSTAHRAVAEATAVVFAMGFIRPTVIYTEDGVLKTATHDGKSFGAGVKNIYGFGIGFPAPYTGPDGHDYPDVGFGGFVAAIKATLPSLLTFAP